MANWSRRSTAEEVSEGIDLSGRSVIVTGANTGIGLETTRVLSLRGARVVMACRDLEKAGRARAQLIAAADDPGIESRVEVMQLDLSQQDSIRSFAKQYLSRNLPLHMLINNAGLMIPDRRATADGFEAHFGVNHLGHFLLTLLLRERLLADGPSRVVSVASEAMQMSGMKADLDDLNWERRKFSGWRSYGSSKLMNAMFANELTRRYGSDGLVSNSLHPGIVETELARDQRWYMAIIGLLMLPAMKNVARGAATSVYLATAPEFETEGGRYYADCKPARLPKLGLDVDAAERLWRISEKLTGLET